MREIEFRGLDSNGIWHYGDLIVDDMGCRICYVINLPPCWSEPGGDTRFEKVQTDFKTVGQYGDIKDMGGQKIYEGDIAKLYINKWVSGHPVYGDDEHFNGYAQGEVVIHKRYGVAIKFPFICDEDSDELLTAKTKVYKTLASCRTEIIGNKFQNPELLLPPIKSE